MLYPGSLMHARPGKMNPPHHSLHVTFSRKTDLLAQRLQPVLRLFQFVMLRRKTDVNPYYFP
jgi:hypothetical protein